MYIHESTVDADDMDDFEGQLKKAIGRLRPYSTTLFYALSEKLGKEFIHKHVFIWLKHHTRDEEPDCDGDYDTLALAAIASYTPKHWGDTASSPQGSVFWDTVALAYKDNSVLLVEDLIPNLDATVRKVMLEHPDMEDLCQYI